MPKPKLKLPEGTGVYETLAIVGQRPAFLALHLERLARGAELLGVPKARERVESLIYAKLGACPPEPVVLRVEAPGHGIPGGTVRPRKQLPAGPLVVFVPKDGKPRGVEDTIKHTARATKVTARNEAQAKGAFEALVLNEKGVVAEGTVTNVFAVVGGALATPGDELFPLPGIARRVVLEEAAKLGVAVQLRGLAVDELASASEVFLTNAAVGVVSVDALILPDGKRLELPAARDLAPRLEAARQAREDEDRARTPLPAAEEME